MPALPAHAGPAHRNRPATRCVYGPGRAGASCHRGRDNLDIAGLLQRGARHLAETAHPWAGYCPGLLLVEFDALVRLAGTDTDRAELLIAELVVNRGSAMHAYDTPSPDILPIDNMVIHTDVVTPFTWTT